MRRHVVPAIKPELCDAIGEVVRVVQGFPVDSYAKFDACMDSVTPPVFDTYASFIECYGKQKSYRDGLTGLEIVESRIRTGLPNNRFVLRALAKKTENRNPATGEVCRVGISVSSKIRPLTTWQAQHWTLKLGGNKDLPPGMPRFLDEARTEVDNFVDATVLWQRKGEAMDYPRRVAVHPITEIPRINHTAHDLTHFRDMVVDMGVVLLAVAGAQLTSEVVPRFTEPPKVRLVDSIVF